MSFYIVDEKFNNLGEYPDRKTVEKELRTLAPGRYAVLQVVSECEIEMVPERVKVHITSARPRKRRKASE